MSPEIARKTALSKPPSFFHSVKTNELPMISYMWDAGRGVLFSVFLAERKSPFITETMLVLFLPPPFLGSKEETSGFCPPLFFWDVCARHYVDRELKRRDTLRSGPWVGGECLSRRKETAEEGGRKRKGGETAAALNPAVQAEEELSALAPPETLVLNST